MTAPMPGHRLLRSFADGSTLAFGPGRFDDWCVYLTRPDQQPDPPRDIDYFARLKAIAARHGSQLLYTDFLTIYHRTTADVSPAILELCYWLSRHYGDDALEVDMLLSILYAGMIAEENKSRARLKKRVKRLGIHQLLIEDVECQLEIPTHEILLANPMIGATQAKVAPAELGCSGYDLMQRAGAGSRGEHQKDGTR